MKKIKTLLSLVIVLSLIFSFAGQSMAAGTVNTQNTEDGRVQIILEFDDAEEAKWASEYIGKMKSKNILSGYPDGTFRPNEPVKRVEAIVTAVRLMGLEEEAVATASSDIKLHFKDADLIDKKYSWAKGYVIVALENGLFDTTEDGILPGSPASRVWVASLLVRALGLQSEAFSQMTTIPDFTDADAIPAGSIGYINVAVENDIVSGYPDDTFKPNKNVTRAEMATLLDRTNGGLLENSGAITVRGTVTELNFASDNTVSQDVYGETISNGEITLKTFNNDTFTYSISPELLVQYRERFIRADQLLIDDVVTLVVQDDKVIEASLLDKEVTEEDSGVLEFKVKVELGDEEEYKLSYKSKKGKVTGEIERKVDGDKQKIKGIEGSEAVQAVMNQLALSPDMGKEEIVQAVLAVLEIPNNQFKELEIEVKFSNGKKVEIEMENDDMPDQGYMGIREFELNFETQDEEKLKLKYKHEEGKLEAEIEKQTDGSNDKYNGDEASEEIEALLDQLALSENMDEDQVLERILSVLEIDKDQLKELEVEIKFTSGKEIEIEMENEDEDDEEDEE